MKLAAIILTRNEERHIQACIASVQWADRVIVFDSGSSDATRDLAAQAGAVVQLHPFENYAQQRNAALKFAATFDWVFFIDADERCSPALQAEMIQTLQTPQHYGYHIPRHNYIFGKLTRHTGWYPDYQMRLLNRAQAYYDPAKQVHEVVILRAGEAGYLQNPLIHYNYDHVAQFHAKQRRYTEYDAQILFEAGIRPKIYTPFSQPLRHFKWRFITLEGYKDGIHGLRLSLLMSWYEFRKYWRLKQLWAAR
jgi:hypothetical protein